MKENGNQTDPGAGYSTGWNARRSLNLLKFSLNHPLMQPRMDEDNDEEMEIVDEAEHVILAATEACKSLDSDNPGSENRGCLKEATPNQGLIPSEVPLVLKSPTSSVSPRVTSSNRQSLRTSSTLTASQNDLASISMFAATNRLAASLHHGLEVIDKHRKSSVLGRSSFRSSYKPVVGEPKSDRKEVGVQTVSMDNEFLCSNCKCKKLDEVEDINDGSDLQLVPVNESPLVDNTSKQIVPKAVEKVLAGAIRREMSLEEFCTKQHTEIMQLNRLVQQYQHERECNSIIGQLQEDKIARLENLMEGVLSAEDFVNEELISLAENNKILREKYENHPEILRKEIELKSIQEELERYQNFVDMGERDVLLEEIVDLRSQLQSYIDCSPKLTKKQSPVLQITYGESTVESAEQKLESERIRFTETESRWITLVEELKSELEANRLLCEKQKHELDNARKCSAEQKEAMQMAMQVHARLLENYADLQEKHTDMLINKRKVQDGIEDIIKAAARAGVKGAESRFIKALASEISTLKVEREKERKRFRDENKGLQEQLRDTAEAVEAAGELLVRLKEAEEAVAAAQVRALEAEQEAENAYKQIEKMRKKQKVEVSPPPVYDMPIYDKGKSSTTLDQ
ncbi:kinesin-like protein KIN-12B, partial [Tanacetum coccineum]